MLLVLLMLQFLALLNKDLYCCWLFLLLMLLLCFVVVVAAAAAVAFCKYC